MHCSSDCFLSGFMILFVRVMMPLFPCVCATVFTAGIPFIE